MFVKSQIQVSLFFFRMHAKELAYMENKLQFDTNCVNGNIRGIHEWIVLPLLTARKFAGILTKLDEIVSVCSTQSHTYMKQYMLPTANTLAFIETCGRP